MERAAKDERLQGLVVDVLVAVRSGTRRSREAERRAGVAGVLDAGGRVVSC